jgi:DNA-binding transcriptional ArsR family regulator
MGNEDTLGQVSGARNRRLPVELAELLTPPLEHALNHPLRRELLRTLHQGGSPRSATELADSSQPELTVTLVNYHAAVLQTCDLVRDTEADVGGDGSTRSYASNVAEDVQILAVLSATESLDRLDT